MSEGETCMQAPQVLTIGTDEEEHARVRDTWWNFDAVECECFKQADKDRIFSIIERYPGGVHAFNDHIKTLGVALFGQRAGSLHLTRPSTASRISTVTPLQNAPLPAVLGELLEGATLDVVTVDATEADDHTNAIFCSSSGSASDTDVQATPRENHNLLLDSMEMPRRVATAKKRTRAKVNKLARSRTSEPKTIKSSPAIEDVRVQD